MNKLRGKILKTDSSGNLTLVDVETPIGELTIIVIDNPETSPFLSTNVEVGVLFNETEVAIAKDFKGQMSFNNQLELCIVSIDMGNIFSKIELEKNGVSIGSLITTRSVKRLGLNSGDTVVALIKTNEIFLKEL